MAESIHCAVCGTESRPEYVKCALTGMTVAGRPENRTWCGRFPFGFTFTDASHAALNGRQEGRLVLCPECRDAIVAALNNGHEEAGR